MNATQKISVSLPKNIYAFVEQYQNSHQCKTRSEVISQALLLLQHSQLEACYREANQEIDHEFENNVVSDGLSNETW